MTSNKRRVHTGWNELHREFDRLLGDLFVDQTDTAGAASWTPRADLAEYGDHFSIVIDLPGIAKKDVSIEYKSEHLEITGERTDVGDEEGREYYRSERERGPFRRVFRFRTAVDGEGIKAVFKNGVLTLTIPKAEASKPRSIKIS